MFRFNGRRETEGVHLPSLLEINQRGSTREGSFLSLKMGSRTILHAPVSRLLYELRELRNTVSVANAILMCVFPN